MRSSPESVTPFDSGELSFFKPLEQTQMIFDAVRKHHIEVHHEQIERVHAARQHLIDVIQGVAVELIPDDPIAAVYLCRELLNEQYSPFKIDANGVVVLDNDLQAAEEKKIAASKNLIEHPQYLIDD
jgi:hypothetical protein